MRTLRIGISLVSGKMAISNISHGRGTNKRRIMPSAWHLARMQGFLMTEDEKKRVKEMLTSGK